MNFKNNALRELLNFSKEYPDYSLGEVLYSSLRIAGIKKLSDLLTISDEELFSAIEKSKTEEKED